MLIFLGGIFLQCLGSSFFVNICLKAHHFLLICPAHTHTPLTLTHTHTDTHGHKKHEIHKLMNCLILFYAYSISSLLTALSSTCLSALSWWHVRSHRGDDSKSFATCLGDTSSLCYVQHAVADAWFRKGWVNIHWPENISRYPPWN